VAKLDGEETVFELPVEEAEVETVKETQAPASANDKE
jgi:hypothetical protein